ncbi:MAG: 30S ribosomal protein S20 [Methylacidiphilales bacterium]|nr:30S ribosomal protein S20 [Candidatus Methylacidiphilales bacterium]MDW8349827.1 30S ribosomal protein S20 [Verrucomicrobiae bacterium]
MANTRSAAKQARKALRRRAINRIIKNKARSAEKQFRALIKSGKKEEAQKLFPLVQSALDKAVKKGTLHRNNANRRKARLAALLAK